jgi:hypothetical protein
MHLTDSHYRVTACGLELGSRVGHARGITLEISIVTCDSCIDKIEAQNHIEEILPKDRTYLVGLVKHALLERTRTLVSQGLAYDSNWRDGFNRDLRLIDLLEQRN